MNKRKGCEKVWRAEKGNREWEKGLRDSGLTLKRDSLCLFLVYHLRQSVWEQKEILFEQWQFHSAKSSTEKSHDSVLQRNNSSINGVLIFSNRFLLLGVSIYICLCQCLCWNTVHLSGCVCVGVWVCSCTSVYVRTNLSSSTLNVFSHNTAVW